MTQPVKKDSLNADAVYICPAPGCTNVYEPFGSQGNWRINSGCSHECSVKAKRNTGTTIIELDAAPQAEVSS